MYPVEGLYPDWEAIEWMGKHLQADKAYYDYSNSRLTLTFVGGERMDVIMWARFLMVDADGSDSDLEDIQRLGLLAGKSRPVQA